MTNNCPFEKSFKSAINRGTPCMTAVNNIAKRENKSTNYVFNSLFKAGMCNRQKFNGQWIYFPTFQGKTTGNSKNVKQCQFDMWQCFVDFCMVNDFCTPEQLQNHCGSQNDFMKYCRKFFNKQFNTGKKTNKTTTRSRKTNKSTGGNYAFPGAKRTNRKVRNAA